MVRKMCVRQLRGGRKREVQGGRGRGNGGLRGVKGGDATFSNWSLFFPNRLTGGSGAGRGLASRMGKQGLGTRFNAFNGKMTPDRGTAIRKRPIGLCWRGVTGKL